jgi:protein ImuA
VVAYGLQMFLFCSSLIGRGNARQQDFRNETGSGNKQISRRQTRFISPLRGSRNRVCGMSIFPRSNGALRILHADLAKAAATYSRTPLGHRAADACLKGGLACGALHEVFAAETGSEAAASSFAAALAMRVRCGKRLLWIRQDFSSLEYGELSATGFLELGVAPSRILLLRVRDVTSALRAAGDALTCAALGAVVIEIPGESKALDLVTSRRLTLAAAKKDVSAFLLRFAAEPDTSAAETRWLIRSSRSPDKKEDWGFPVFDAVLARNRHGATGNWMMEWNCDEHAFCEPAHRGAVVSLPSDRSSRTTRAA